MRILHVVRSSAFYGVERYIATLASAQARMDDTVVVVGGDRDRMRSVLAGTGVGFAPGDTLAQVLSALWAGLRRADVAHVHMTEAELAVTAVQRARLHYTPVVATRHFAQPRGASRLGSVVAPFIGRRLDGQIAISRFVADRIDGDSHVIHPGVPVPIASPAERAPVILVAQRLEAEKSTDVALRAFAASGLAPEGWRLKIAGSGALSNDLRALATALKLNDHVDFLGRRDDMDALMARSSLLMATAAAEPFGLTVVEAMAAGLPVVASTVGGHLESLAPATLRYGFEPGDVSAAAHSLRELAGNPELRAHLAAVGRDRHGRSLTPQAQAEATRDFYDAVMAGSA